MTVLIQRHQLHWKSAFEEIKVVILATLGDIEILVEHVGSTAVPGLAAKPIIDIDLVYFDATAFEQVKNAIVQLGYFHNGDQGLPGREVFKRKPQENPHPVLDRIDHHLYVCRAEIDELRRHLLFRDFLRQNESARKKYEDLKYQIAERANQNRKKYAELKEVMAREFIEDALRRAEGK